MRDELLEIFRAALAAADPYTAVLRHLERAGDTLIADGVRLDLGRFRRVLVVGAGKAASPMARAVEEVLGDKIETGLVVVKYGHAMARLERIAQVEASHPLPDDAGVSGAEWIVGLLGSSGEDTLVVCVLSGGASALLVAPVDGVSLDEKRAATELLLKAGASIDELNAVRKHLSRVKGGRLAALARPATMLTLLLSDVVGDRLDVIASGPAVPDGSTFRDAVSVVEKYGLSERLPASVMRALREGLSGRLPETPKGGEPFFENTFAVVVASLKDSLLAARSRAVEMGLDAEVLASDLQGEAREVARRIAAAALRASSLTGQGQRGRCLISGGETTVTVKGGGRGGRNQELALAFALEIEGVDGVTMLSAGTDGTDGENDAAGAIVDGTTAAVARGFGIDPKDYLADNDSYGFFERFDSMSGSMSHLKTGPTGTNVMDIQIVGVRRPSQANHGSGEHA